MQTTTAHSTHEHDNHDHGFDDYVAAMSKRVESITEPLFTTDTTGLFALYLAQLPTNDRQYYNCNTCAMFFERFGGLVTIDGNGVTSPVMWLPSEAPTFYKRAVEALWSYVVQARVTGVFLSKAAAYGCFETATPIRWTHFAVKTNPKVRYTGRVLTAEQATAEKGQDYLMLTRALGELTVEQIETAVTLLRSDTLYRSEKVLGVGEWLLALKQKVKHERRAHKLSNNMVWSAVATAPAGFCHVRSSMIGTLLEDIRAGKDLANVKASFAAKMAPTAYQRPQAAPSLGTIKQAEALVAQLGIERSLERRFSRCEEIKLCWSPRPRGAEANDGVFGHLKKTKVKQPLLKTTAVENISWAKFERTVLPSVLGMRATIPSAGAFFGLVTATHADAPPIIQWDTEDARNPVSWYMYAHGSAARQWGLTRGTQVVVKGVCDLPAHWNGELPRFGKRKFLILEGAADIDAKGLNLFPEIIKSELHSVRSVIEAHSNSGYKTGKAQASACGIDAEGVRLTVEFAGGVFTHYHIDRME